MFQLTNRVADFVDGVCGGSPLDPSARAPYLYFHATAGAIYITVTTLIFLSYCKKETVHIFYHLMSFLI